MPDHATKHCPKCDRDLPLDAFQRDSSAADGRQRACRECRSRHAREYSKTHPDAVRATQKKYRNANRELVQARGREYMRRPEIRERSRRQYEANRATRIAQMRRNYRENREAYLAYCRARYEQKGEQIRAQVRRRATEIRTLVFGYYGTSCVCCGRADDLCIDHIAGNGREHRQELFGRQETSVQFYYWLIKQGFPDGYQTLCRPCNTSKATGERCRLRHN